MTENGGGLVFINLPIEKCVLVYIVSSTRLACNGVYKETRGDGRSGRHVHLA